MATFAVFEPKKLFFSFTTILGSKMENVATIDLFIILKVFQLISVGKICRNMGSKVSAP